MFLQTKPIKLKLVWARARTQRSQQFNTFFFFFTIDLDIIHTLSGGRDRERAEKFSVSKHGENCKCVRACGRWCAYVNMSVYRMWLAIRYEYCVIVLCQFGIVIFWVFRSWLGPSSVRCSALVRFTVLTSRFLSQLTILPAFFTRSLHSSVRSSPFPPSSFPFQFISHSTRVKLFVQDFIYMHKLWKLLLIHSESCINVMCCVTSHTHRERSKKLHKQWCKNFHDERARERATK